MAQKDQTLDIRRSLAPGTPLRNAIELILRQETGALIVLGYGRDIEAICTGGFHLDGADFGPARLAELAKMDGAVITDQAAEVIYRANVHLIPDPSIATNETGTRHRTAERVAIQTGRPVVEESRARPRGYRMLDRIPRLPDAVKTSLVGHFGNLQHLLSASVGDLDQVEGVGRARARQLRRFFDPPPPPRPAR